VAQRVMDFADIGQLLVSRSYYDAVSRISQEYAGMFHYQGSRTDKHVREHEVYAIGYPGEFTLAKENLAAKGKLQEATDEVMQGLGRWGGVVLDAFRNASGKQRLLFVGTPLIVVLLLGIILLVVKRGPVTPAKQVVVRYYPEADQAVTPANALTVKKSETTGSARDVGRNDSVKKNDKPNIARVRTLEETTGAVAIMNLVVLPWGEVYLDGRMQGVSPPLLELQVAPGKHEIEIRNANFPVFRQTIQAKVGEKIRINHTFAN